MASRIEAGYRRPEDIAPLVGKSWRQVREYEKGNVAPPFDVLCAWAKVTGKPLEYFMPAQPPPEEEQPAAQIHPGIESLAADAATLTRYAITPGELDLLCGGIYPVTITEKRDALDLLLVNLRAGPRSVESTYQKSHHKPPISRSRPR